MDKYSAVKVFVLLLFLIKLPLLEAGSATQPNIIFILVDDLGFAEVGFNGSQYYETPAIDALANTGLVLENAYMYPTCSPSRTALFTGKQSFRTGVYTVPVLEKGSKQENIFSRWTVGKEHIGYSQPLAGAGYKMGFFGKWHLVGPYPDEELEMTFPLDQKLKQPDPWDYSWADRHKSDAIAPYYPRGRGYLKNVGGTYRGDPALEVDGYRGPTGGYFAPFNNPFIETNPKDNWLTDHLTTEAINFMNEHKAHPFFIDLHYYTVHNPLRKRSEELYHKYMAKEGDPVIGQGIGEKKSRDATYATMIESLDDNVQRLVDYLESNGLRENTIIFFTSDNGQNGGANNRLRGFKGLIYEGGIRVPTFVNWPGKIDARRTATPVMVTDYFPTFMELAGIHYTGVLDGRSIVPLFAGESRELQQRALFWQLNSQWKHGTCSVIRKDNYKLIQFLADGSLELYDLEHDLREENNLAAEKPELTQTMLKELVRWRVENKVPLPPNAAMQH